MQASDQKAVIGTFDENINVVDREEKEQRQQEGAERLRVTVIGDWLRCSRGNLWPEVLARVEEKLGQGINPVEIELTIHPFADQLAKPVSNPNQRPARQHILQRCDVLIINWDAINGDPNFGFHISQQWLEQEGHLEILVWVKEGGILIVEGQATLSVANQKAYDALLGRSEVSVCEMEDELDVSAQVKQVGYVCKMTRAACNCELFRGLDDINSSSVSRKHEDMFPKCAPFVTLHKLQGSIGWNILYRGWFRWIIPLRRRRLHWVPLIKTAGRRWNHPTMLVARHGNGAIFVSTMLLATSEQVELISRLLQCHSRTNLLPSPSKSVFSLLQQHIARVLWPVVVTVFAVLIAGKSPIVQGIATWVLLVVGSFIFWILGYLLQWLGLRKLLRAHISWG